MDVMDDCIYVLYCYIYTCICITIHCLKLYNRLRCTHCNLHCLLKRCHYNYYLIIYFILGSLAIAAKTFALVGSRGHIH